MKCFAVLHFLGSLINFDVFVRCVQMAGLKGGVALGTFHWMAPMTQFMTTMFASYIFADLQGFRCVFW